MEIVFRCDASSDIGLGHLIRCIAVAKELKGRNHVVFATTGDDTNSIIREHGFDLFLTEEEEEEEVFLNRVSHSLKPEIVVIDKKYNYSFDFLSDLKRDKIELVMIDNLCEGLRMCDKIIIPAAHLDKNLLRKYLSQEQIDHVKTGPGYVILRDEILALKDQVSHELHTPPNIVVTTGGTDPEGVLLRLIPWLKEMDLDANVLLLVGHAFKFKDELEAFKKGLPDNIKVIPYSPEEIVKGDIAICTFGVSIYELIYLHIPTICISHNRENARSAKILKEQSGVMEDLGYVKDISQEKLYKAASKLLTDKRYYKDMVARCGKLLDGMGAKRIAKIIARVKKIVNNAIVSIAAGESQRPLLKKIRDRGFSVIGVDRNPEAPGFEFCDDCIIESTHNAEAIIKTLEDLRQKWKFCGIITQSSGIPVITAAKIAKHFNLRYVLPDIASNILDKGKLIPALNEKGIPSPKVKVISDKGIADIDFSPPFFVKPSICHQSHTAMTKVEEYSSLQHAVKKAMEVSEKGCVNVEQFISGIDIVSIDWVYNKKIIHVATIEEINSGKPYFYGLGWRVPVPSKSEEIIKKVQKQFIDATDIDNSLVQTSMKLDGEKAYIIEVHLDLGGDGIPEVLVPYSLNYDLLDNGINLAIGKSPHSRHILAIPTYLRFILKSEIKCKQVKMFKYIKNHFVGTPVEFNGLIAPMNDEIRIGAIIFQSSSTEELNSRVKKFERWLKTQEVS